MTVAQSVSNFLVPATGTTNAYQITQTFSSTPLYVEFSSVGLSGTPFRPSGVIIDNSQGTDSLTILINEMSFKMVCPKGGAMQMPFPAPLNCTANITGAGTATVVFVDYPVIPFVFSGAGATGTTAVSIADGDDAALGKTTDAEETDPTATATAISILKGILAGVNATSGGTYAAAITSSTTTGTVAAGTFSVSFNNTGSAAATVAGGSLPAGSIVSFEAPNGGTLDAIAYDGTGTTLLISTLTKD